MMSLRRAAALALPLLLAACTTVTQEPQAPDLVFATFASPNVPTPNDLALAAIPAYPCAALPDAQAQLLCTFKNAGGWPSDQEVPITVPFTAAHWDASVPPYGAYVPVAAPAIDLSSVTASSVTVRRVDVTPVEVVTVEASSTAGSCTAGVCKPATLTLRKAADATGSRRWAAGARYVVGIRGGALGVKTTTGLPVSADSAVALAIPNKDLTVKENQPLGAVPDSNGNGSNADEVAQLEAVRKQLWLPLDWSNATGVWAPVPTPDPTITPAFTAIDGAFPLAETASAAAFGTAPSAGPVVLIDSGSGVAPLPIDLLRTDADGTIDFNPAFGPAAAGLGTLDGFSTTAMMLAQTSGPIDASTVNGANVFLYRLGGAAPVLVRELKYELGKAGLGDPTANPAAAGYVAQPSPIVAAQGASCPIVGGCSSVIGLQPAVTAPVPGVGNFFLPPLPASTKFAVVVTNRVKGITATGLVPLARPTVAKIILEFTRPLAIGGKSAIPGVGDATAVALATMQSDLAPLWAAGVLPTGTTKADVVTAYTFKTQSTVSTSLQLAAAPYGIEAGAVAAGSPTPAIFTTVAAPTTVSAPAGYPTANVAAFFTIPFNSVDGIDKATGAFRPTLAADLGDPAILPTLLTQLSALVAIPDPTAGQVPLCPGATAPAGPFCPKLVIFGHGLNGSKETLFATASSLASAGFVAAAIDFPLHGGRNWCGADADCVVPGTGADGTCDKASAFASSAGQGDAVRPGVCSGGSIPKPAGSRYFVSANFFRSRDALRQNVLDVSALALALARPPAPLAPQPAQNPFALALAAAHLVLDPSAIYYEGISLGSISGTSAVAANPRITRASLSVGGGTIVDIFTNAPAFQSGVDALFASLIPGYTRAKITSTDPAFDPAIAASYLKTINVAKWILDPGDPINYAQHLRAAPLPNLLANPDGSVPMAAKEVFAQVALGDTTVPNAFNYLLDNLIGAHITTYSDDNPAGGPAPHSMLGTTPQVQADAAGFLLDPTNTANYPATRALPFP
jgi:hypothetical protein